MKRLLYGSVALIAFLAGFAACGDSAEKKQRKALEFNAMAVDLEFEGKNDEALVYYNKAIELTGEVAAIYANRGAALLSAGDTVAAVADWRKAVELDPTHAVAPFNIAQLNYNLQKYDEALDWYVITERLDPNAPQIRQSIGTCRYWLGDYEGALEDYFYHGERNEWDNKWNYYLIGEAYLRIDELKTAREYFVKALELDNPEAQIKIDSIDTKKR